MKDLIGEFERVVNVVVVYIKEAHPIDGSVYIGSSFNLKQPKTMDERLVAVRMFYEELGDVCPLFVDDISDEANLAYGAQPERLCIIEKGMVTYISQKGPRGFTIGLPEVRLRLQAFSKASKK